MLWLNTSLAQPANYAARYNTPENSTYVYDDNVLITQLEPSTAFSNNHGFVMFKTADNSNTFLNDLIIHAIRDDGTLLGTRRIEFNNIHVVPVACAFNTAKNQYIVTGTARNLFNNQTFDTWYLVLNTGLQIVYSGAFSLQAGLGITSNQTFVTDVCPVYNMQGIDFAFTGTILEDGINTSPSNEYSQNQAPSNKRLFIVTLETSTYTINTAHYDFDKAGSPVNEYFFPSRIIEIPTANNGGFLVGGTGVSNGTANEATALFYLRTDYNLGVYDYKNIDATTYYNGNLMCIGAMHYDHDSDEVHIAGSLRYSSAGRFGFLFDKIMNLNTTPNIQSFSIEPTAWNGQIGIKGIPNTIDGFPKVGHITAHRHTSSYFKYIGGKIMGGNYFNTQNLPVLMDCMYNDNQLINWTTNQNTDIHYYKRQNNSNTPLQYYVNGYNYDQMWYPTHGTTDLDYNAYNSVQQALTSIDDVSDDVVLCLTDNTYDLYNCDDGYFDASRVLSSVYITTQNTVTQQAPTPFTMVQPYTASNINNPTVDFCDPFNMFKSSSDDISNTIRSINNQATSIIINCIDIDEKFTLFDISGKALLKGNVIQNKINLSTINIQKGIYILCITSQNNQVNNIKLIIN